MRFGNAIAVSKKLTAEHVRSMRQMYKAHFPLVHIAASFDVTADYALKVCLFQLRKEVS